MTLIHSFPRRWAMRVLAPVSAAVLACALSAHAAAATAPVSAEAKVQSYLIPQKPSNLLRASEAIWKPLLAEAAAALDERAKASSQLTKATLIELHVQRTVLSQAQHAWPAVLEAVEKTRQLQDGESGRRTAGLLNEVLARQALTGGDAAWLQKQLRDQVLAMPWAEVEQTIRALRQQVAQMKSEAIEAYVGNKMDFAASAAENKANLGFVMQLLALRFQLLEVMPRQQALLAGLDEAIAQRDAAGK
jgi:hypothetical protein